MSKSKLDQLIEMNRPLLADVAQALWPKPTFLPLMNKPLRSVEKESAETCMRALLERTCAELRLKPNGP